MAHIMRLLTGLLFIVLMATLAQALAQAQIRVEPVAPMPAWCGGSYSITGGLDAKAYHEAASQNAVPSGTNFGDCVTIEQPVRGVQGASVISVPTYPATPASQVLLDGERMYHVSIDGEGRETRLELALPSNPNRN